MFSFYRWNSRSIWRKRFEDLRYTGRRSCVHFRNRSNQGLRRRIRPYPRRVDFLKHYCLLVDIRKRQIIDDATSDAAYQSLPTHWQKSNSIYYGKYSKDSGKRNLPLYNHDRSTSWAMSTQIEPVAAVNGQGSVWIYDRQRNLLPGFHRAVLPNTGSTKGNTQDSRYHILRAVWISSNDVRPNKRGTYISAIHICTLSSEDSNSASRKSMMS